MGTNPSPMRRAFLCPLCGQPIEALEPHETRNAPEPADFRVLPFETHESAMRRYRMEQNMAANEALINAHLTTSHTMTEALVALGTARNALMDIQAAVQRPGLGSQHIADAIVGLCARGLGEQ